ncbi:lipocalin family protein [Gemmobacter serpentinus]|uniref:lipocalin family protein n=1 Tax=Gemmobacter serpentinus TaxID=2652247 RepID=UPI001CF64C07|nr:lipocalin family protein [Gemmobacter serpentinus]
MYRLTVLKLATLALLALTACGAPKPEIRQAYRNQGQPIYSNAVLDPARLQGDWHQVASFAASPGGCKPGGVRIGAPQGASIPLQADLCLGGARQRFAGQAALPVPGRLIPETATPQGITQPWWIIWADVDLRTLVIGTPTGEMGFILERSGRLPADRLTAAREILDWNGYDLGRLQLF